MRLTQKDERGNWCLKGVSWEQLHEGQVITKSLWERLYGALCKLMEYEDTGLTPEEIEQLKDKATISKMENVGWIPVEERLPTREEYLKDNGRFILDDGNRRYQGLFDIYDGKFKFSKHISGLNYKLFDDECVIAWQPLPDQYHPPAVEDWRKKMANVFMGDSRR